MIQVRPAPASEGSVAKRLEEEEAAFEEPLYGRNPIVRLEQPKAGGASEDGGRCGGELVSPRGLLDLYQLQIRGETPKAA